MEWQDIRTAPKGGSGNGYQRWQEPPYIDILAKRWVFSGDADRFEFHRFVDCRWESDGNNKKWEGVDVGWFPVAWMPRPDIPTEWPPAILAAPPPSVKPNVPDATVEFDPDTLLPPYTPDIPF